MRTKMRQAARTEAVSRYIGRESAYAPVEYVCDHLGRVLAVVCGDHLVSMPDWRQVLDASAEESILRDVEARICRVLMRRNRRLQRAAFLRKKRVRDKALESLGHFQPKGRSR